MNPEYEGELRESLDRLAIQDLIYRYSDAVNRADLLQFESVFASDALLESPSLGLRYEGRAAIRAFLEPTTTYDVLIQTPHSPVVTLISAHVAQAITTIHELVRGKATLDTTLGPSGTEYNFEQYGIYYDDLARIDGEWNFTHRLFVPIYVGSGGVTGDVLTPRSALLRSDQPTG
jgi:ketosteroid isomerase-like protein